MERVERKKSLIHSLSSILCTSEVWDSQYPGRKEDKTVIFPHFKIVVRLRDWYLLIWPYDIIQVTAWRRKKEDCWHPSTPAVNGSEKAELSCTLNFRPLLCPCNASTGKMTLGSWNSVRYGINFLRPRQIRTSAIIQMSLLWNRIGPPPDENRRSRPQSSWRGLRSD